MLIREDYILNLISAKKYNSCFLTTFSFDFSFFESQVLRILRQKGIQNVLVCADGYQLENQLENLTGYEYKLNPYYTLFPIYRKGAFHPKIIFCTGKNKGLLLIGSGNLTSSGHGWNDELWSAFHIKGDGNIQTNSIFYSFMEYLKYYTEELEGQAKEKLMWIQEFSNWISNLNKGEIANDVRFIHNRENSLYSQIKESLSNQDVNGINIVSPYYDLHGDLLQMLSFHFPGINIKCLVDIPNGILPYNISVNKAIHFFSYQSLFSDEKTHRLHGKLIEFKTAKKSIIYSGSANATICGLGEDGFVGKNEEVGMIFHLENSYLKNNLSIDFNILDIVNLINQKKVNISEPGMEKLASFNARIVLTEKRNKKLTISLSSELKEDAVIKVRSHNIDWVDIVIVEKGSKKYVIDKCEDDFQVCAFFNQNNRRFSNISVIQDYAIHQSTNPDPIKQKIKTIFNEISIENSEISDLLEYVILDYNKSNRNIQKTGGSDSKNEESLHKGIEEDKDKFSELNKQKYLNENNYDVSTNVEIATFLAFLSKNNFDSENKQSDNIPDDFDIDQGKDDDLEEIDNEEIIYEIQKVQRSLIKYFKKYYDSLSFIVNGHLHKDNIFDKIRHPLNINDLSVFYITLKVANIYSNKSHDIEKSEKYFNWIKRKSANNYDNYNDLIFNVSGMFLLLASNGFVKPENESDIEKFEFFKTEIPMFIFYSICNLQKQIDDTHIKLIIINTLYSFFQEKINFIDLIKRFRKFEKKLLETNIFKSHTYYQNRTKLIVIIKKLVFLTDKDNQKYHFVEKPKLFSYIKNAHIGVAMVKRIIVENDKTGDYKLKLLHPGFRIDKEQNENEYLFPRGFSKNLIFKLNV